MKRTATRAKSITSFVTGNEEDGAAGTAGTDGFGVFAGGALGVVGGVVAGVVIVVGRGAVGRMVVVMVMVVVGRMDGKMPRVVEKVVGPVRTVVKPSACLFAKTVTNSTLTTALSSLTPKFATPPGGPLGF